MPLILKQPTVWQSCWQHGVEVACRVPTRLSSTAQTTNSHLSAPTHKTKTTWGSYFKSAPTPSENVGPAAVSSAGDLVKPSHATTRYNCGQLCIGIGTSIDRIAMHVSRCLKWFQRNLLCLVKARQHQPWITLEAHIFLHTAQSLHHGNQRSCGRHKQHFRSAWIAGPASFAFHCICFLRIGVQPLRCGNCQPMIPVIPGPSF